MQRFDVGPLPADPVMAAAACHAGLGPIRTMLAAGVDCTLVFAARQGERPHEHDGWRTALVAALARAHAPARVNALGGESTSDIAATVDFLARAPGVTGQYWRIDGTGAGPCL